MFVVKRNSKTGGTEYLVDRMWRGLRWDKKKKINSHLFQNRNSASRCAKKYGGKVAEY